MTRRSPSHTTSSARVAPRRPCIMALCPCDGTDFDAAACGWSSVKEGHWEIGGGGYRYTVLRARATVRQSTASERIEQLVCMLCCSPETLLDPSHLVQRYMLLSGGCEALGRAMRILFADCWAFREAQQSATWPLIHRARKLWKHMNLSAKEYSRWMQAIWKAARFYWAVGTGTHGDGTSEACECALSI